jgi:hypothetical protein
MVKSPYIVVFGFLVALGPGTGRAQTLDRADTLPISMQAEIGNTIEIKCDGPTAIPFTPASGSTKTLKCGDWITILGARGSSYFVRMQDSSTGFVPVTVFPTDPCVQTRYRSSQFRKQWVSKVDSMSKDVFLKFKNQLYLAITPDDVSVAYQEQTLGGMAGFANSLNPEFNVSGPTTLAPEAKARLMKFAEALDSQLEALNLLTSATTAQTFAYATRHDDLLDRYNALVEKHNNFMNFVDQRMHDLDNASPPAPQPSTSTWRQIIDGILQGVANFTPPKHLVCDTKIDLSRYENPFQPSFIYLKGGASSLFDCQEK